MVFTIKEGKHYSDNRFHKAVHLLRTKTISYDVTFTESCKYQLGSPDQLDINKLFGYSNCIDPHIESTRVGWRWNGEKIAIFAYLYRDGARSDYHIKDIECGVEYTIQLERIEGHDIFKILRAGAVVAVEVFERKPSLFAWSLWPYFGGNQTAPHDIHIQLN